MRFGKGSTKKQQQAEVRKDEKLSSSPRGRSRTPKEEKVRRLSSGSTKSRKKSSTSNRSSRRSTSKKKSENMPVIDRIPTAIGYHSDDSEDEWLEQKSKCSRYSGRYDPVTVDTVEDRDAPPEEEYEEDLDDDRYSTAKKAKSSNKKKSNSPSRAKSPLIERLWSDSSFETQYRELEYRKQKVEKLRGSRLPDRHLRRRRTTAAGTRRRSTSRRSRRPRPPGRRSTCRSP